MTSGRRLTTVDRVTLPASRARFARDAGLVALAYIALFVCAAVPTWPGLVAAAVAVAGAELNAFRRGSLAAWAGERVGLAVTARGLLRGVALVLFAARATSPTVTIWTALVVAALAGLRGVAAAALRVITYLRSPLVAARGLDVRLPRLPAAPGGWLTRIDAVALVVDTVAAAALAAADAADRRWPAVTAWIAVTAVTAGTTALLLGQAGQLWRIRAHRRVADAVQERIAELEPEVVAYLGNGTEWRYQLEVWLRTLEAMNRRVLLLVRDHEVLTELAPTSLPVVSIPGGTTLMTFPLPGLRVALYVGNTANNLHLLRRPGVRSVFVGHGDSDKGASANPFARAYQEIWVAGPAGRDRYAAAGVDLPDSAFVEVGRPQLRELPRRPDAEPRLTVLYAPTWEGWGEDAFHSSLPHVGPQLVAALLDRGDVRVMYRPHPRTGHRDPAIRKAHQEILRLLESAGARPPQAAPLPPPPTGRPASSGDILDRMARGPEAWSPAEHDAAVQRWTDAFWAAHPGHRILTSPAPELHACFEMADALIADISSVPTDFLAANRPYAIVNCTDRPAAEFREWSATARGGFLLGPDLAGLDALIGAAGPGPDLTAAARAEARRYLLGPRTADPAARFREELDRICGTPNYVG